MSSDEIARRYIERLLNFSDQIESIGDTVGANAPGISNEMYRAQGVLRQYAKDYAINRGFTVRRPVDVIVTEINPGCGCCSYVDIGVRSSFEEAKAAYPGDGYEFTVEEITDDGWVVE